MKRSNRKSGLTTNRDMALQSAIVLKDKGSPEWCYQKVAFLRDVFQMEQLTLQQWEKAIDELKKYRAWDKIPEERPYGSLDALLQAEIGIESEKHGRDTIQHRMMRAAGQTKTDADDGKMLPIGNSPNRQNADLRQSQRAKNNGVGIRTQRKLDHLAKHFPDICRLVAEGQLTVAAATRAANIEKELIPLQLVQRAWRKANTDDKRQIRTWIDEQWQADLAKASFDGLG